MRNISQCHPKLQKYANELVTACERKGLKIKITECLRTVAEQDALYAQGRTKPGNIVTNAKGSSYSSMHQWGIAFDFCRNDGKGAFDDSDGFFEKVGKIGVTIGLEWGGNWKSIKDRPHFQLPDWGSTTTKLKKQYGKPEVFMAAWKSTSTKTSEKTTTATAAKATTNDIKYFKKYTGQSDSIVMALASLVYKSDFQYRDRIAAVNEIRNYSGTAEQNTKMLKLLKKGKLIKP